MSIFENYAENFAKAEVNFQYIANEAKGENWSKAEVLCIEAGKGRYSKNILFTAWGGEIIRQAKQMKSNNRYIITYQIESKCYNSKWSTNVNIKKIEKVLSATELYELEQKRKKQEKKRKKKNLLQRLKKRALKSQNFFVFLVVFK